MFGPDLSQVVTKIMRDLVIFGGCVPFLLDIQAKGWMVGRVLHTYMHTNNYRAISTRLILAFVNNLRLSRPHHAFPFHSSNYK